MASTMRSARANFVLDTDPPPRPEATIPFRELIPSPSHPRIVGIDRLTAREWCESRRKQGGLAAQLIGRLEAQNLSTPLRGFTTDGNVRRGVYDYAEDEGAPTEEAMVAVERLMEVLPQEQREDVQFKGVEEDEIRLWSNPELYINPGGLRLDECTEAVQTAIHAVLKASMSPQGYEKVLGCCLTNGFLGHLVNGPRVLNEHSYNFRLFGTASLSQQWGYAFFGHHLCLAVVFHGKRMVIGPTFLGAEPDVIDEGPHQGLRLFQTEEMVALKLMQSLSPDLQERTTVSKEMDGTSLPVDRWNPFDERHLGGVRQDDRVVPYEGCPVSLFHQPQQSMVFDLFRAFNEYYPANVLAYRIRTFWSHLDETYFAWIGGFGDDDPYYYRIHSPVCFLELDFHCGIFLTNTSPSRCHIHTVNRLPNRGDYGRAMLEQL